MPRIILYIASSEDGYIADAQGGVAWLDKYNDGHEDCGYAVFFDSIDALIIGRKTYEQILGFGAWPYGDKPCYIFSSNGFVQGQGAKPSIYPVALSPEAWLAAHSGEGRYWLVGGAALAQSFLDISAINDVVLTTLPEKLGTGIALPRALWSRVEGLSPAKTYPNGILQYTFQP